MRTPPHDRQCHRRRPGNGRFEVRVHAPGMARGGADRASPDLTDRGESAADRELRAWLDVLKGVELWLTAGSVGARIADVLQAVSE